MLNREQLDEDIKKQRIAKIIQNQVNLVSEWMENEKVLHKLMLPYKVEYELQQKRRNFSYADAVGKNLFEKEANELKEVEEILQNLKNEEVHEVYKSVEKKIYDQPCIIRDCKNVVKSTDKNRKPCEECIEFCKLCIGERHKETGNIWWLIFDNKEDMEKVNYCKNCKNEWFLKHSM